MDTLVKTDLDCSVFFSLLFRTKSCLVSKFSLNINQGKRRILHVAITRDTTTVTTATTIVHLVTTATITTATITTVTITIATTDQEAVVMRRATTTIRR